MDYTKEIYGIYLCDVTIFWTQSSSVYFTSIARLGKLWIHRHYYVEGITGIKICETLLPQPWVQTHADSLWALRKSFNWWKGTLTTIWQARIPLKCIFLEMSCRGSSTFLLSCTLSPVLDVVYENYMLKLYLTSFCLATKFLQTLESCPKLQSLSLRWEAFLNLWHYPCMHSTLCQSWPLDAIFTQSEFWKAWNFLMFQ